jgi:hypothetical protein
MLTFTGLLTYVAVKKGFFARKPSVSASSATPAGVSMTSSQASNKVLEVKIVEVKIDGKPVQLQDNLSDVSNKVLEVKIDGKPVPTRPAPGQSE